MPRSEVEGVVGAPPHRPGSRTETHNGLFWREDLARAVAGTNTGTVTATERSPPRWGCPCSVSPAPAPSAREVIARYWRTRYGVAQRPGRWTREV